MVNSCGLSFGVYILGLCILNVHGSAGKTTGLEPDHGYRESSCYAMAVYNEIMRAIKIINSSADRSTAAYTSKRNQDQPERAASVSNHPISRRFQEDEDYGNGENGIEIPSIVPMIFKIVGSALSLNSSGVQENSMGFIPAQLSNRLTSVLGSLATAILGPARPTPRPPPPRRRRRSTTTTEATSSTSTDAPVTTTEMGTTKAEPTTLPPTSPPAEATEFSVESEAISIEIQETSPLSFAGVVNETTFLFEAEIVNVTEESAYQEEGKNGTEKAAANSSTIMLTPTSTTTKVLYEESNLGELPVYAAAYAPNYVATTPYPVYASNFLHVLYPAPTTTTTTTPGTTSTSADPNSYNVALPFDYDREMMVINATSASASSTVVPTKEEMITFDPNIATTPNIDYEEYEYEERTETLEAEIANVRSAAQKVENRLAGKVVEEETETTAATSQSKSGSFRNKNRGGMAEDEDDEYLDNDSNKNRSLSSLGRISRSIKLN